MASYKTILKLALIPVLFLALYAYLRFLPIIRNTVNDGKPELGFSKTRDNGQTLTVVSNPDEHIPPYDFKVDMERLNALKVEADDPRLIFLIKKFYTEPPSVFPYNLTKPYLQDFSQGGQSLYVDNLLEHREHGFFVESGAFDGEKASASLFFEKHRQWNGLLIDANPYEFNKLRSKHRKAFSVNACLSKFSYPSQMVLKISGVTSKIKDEQAPRNKPVDEKSFAVVQCFPFYSILLAIGRTSVDYFTLDIEGYELLILKTIPWDRVDIKVLVVEYIHIPEGLHALIDFMATKDYINMPLVRKPHWLDVVFVKKGFQYNKTFTV